ncbi:MRC2 protein, partial [Atractosteus spatula]|nr:MRC2 protein [Atractosteus spatula]
RQYHFVGLEKSWTEAQSYCRENYTDLAVIENREDNEQLLQTVRNPVQYTGWIGLYRDQWSWQWSMGNIHLYNQNESNFTNWATGQPENNGGKENCGIMASRGLWHDYPCSCSFHFICYQDSGDPAKRYFLINATANFTAAQRYCREHHTDLASARNRSENEEVRLTAQGNYVWIGLFMEPWKWSSPSYSAFYNWDQNQPDNAGGNENCAALALTGSTRGRWSDTDCAQRFPFFCFSEGRDSAGSYFVIETNKNFTAAQRYCQEHHTDLASVRNRSENEEIRRTARGNYVWIGLFVEHWKWSSPSNPAFRNWTDSVPDNVAGNEDCASLLMTGSSAEYWNDTRLRSEAALLLLPR